MVEGLRRDVEALAAMERGSAGPGERAAAEWAAGRLREAGAHDVALETFRYQSSWGARQGPHFAAGLLAAARGGRAGAALALATLVSFELEFSGRAQWLARLAPAGEGANVVARLPAGGERRRTVVLVAHHDAAQTGVMWRVLDAAGRRLPGRPDAVEPFSLLPELALAAAAVLPRSRGARAVAATLLASSVASSLNVALSPTVPGASDNATGVAAALALAERLAAEPLEGTEVVVLLAGCEESGMGGMAAWMSDHGRDLDPATTLILGLDTLGAGEPVVLGAEGPLLPVRYAAEDLAWADRGAELAGQPPPRRFRLGGWTDPALARIAGLPTISLLSVRGRMFTNYHLPTDTPDRVDWDSVERCARLAHGIARAFAAG